MHGLWVPSRTAKRAKSKWSRSKFGQVMEEAGLLLGEGDQENLLSECVMVYHDCYDTLV